MTQKSFTLRIVTVAEPLYDGEAVELHCRGVSGQMTVLANHEPLITPIDPCTLRVTTTLGENKEFHIRGGVLEVADNKMVVLCSPQT
jgi:F-type H+-transporting ATPase subunit epsilon